LLTLNSHLHSNQMTFYSKHIINEGTHSHLKLIIIFLQLRVNIIQSSEIIIVTINDH